MTKVYKLKYKGPMASIYYLDAPYQFDKGKWIPVTKEYYDLLKGRPNMDQRTYTRK